MSAGSGTLGKYQIIREIARSNDIVYEAYDPAMNRRVALKELNLPSGATDKLRGERMARFLREAKAAGSLAHANIVTIYEVGEDNGRHYIAMEYLEGQTLRQKLDAEGLIPQDEAARIIGEVLAGLSYAHEHGIIHRDVKPDNIQLLPEGRVKLTDFGIARLTFEPSLTMDGQVFGTPSYMSPEQIVGRDIDARTDIFSTGVVLYEAIAGKKPFTGDSVVSISHAIMHYDPPDPQQASFSVAQVIRKALDKSPELRFNSAKAMAQALSDAISALRSDPQLAQSPTMLSPTAAPWGPPLDPYAPPIQTPYPPQPPPHQQVPPAYGQPYGQPYAQPYGQAYGQPGVPTSQPYNPAPYPPAWLPPPHRPILSPAASDFIVRTLWVIFIGLMIVGLGFAAVYAINAISEKQHASQAAPVQGGDKTASKAGSGSEKKSPRAESQMSARNFDEAYANFIAAADAAKSDPELYLSAGDAAREAGRKSQSVSERLDWFAKSRDAYMKAYTCAAGSALNEECKKQFEDATVREAVELTAAGQKTEAARIMDETYAMVPMSEEEASSWQQLTQSVLNGG